MGVKVDIFFYIDAFAWSCFVMVAGFKLINAVFVRFLGRV